MGQRLFDGRLTGSAALRTTAHNRTPAGSAPLAIMGQCKPEPDKYREPPNAAIERLFELIAGPEPATDSRRGPGDEQIPNRAVEIEDGAQDQKCQWLRGRIRQNKLRQKRQTKQR